MPTPPDILLPSPLSKLLVLLLMIQINKEKVVSYIKSFNCFKSSGSTANTNMSQPNAITIYQHGSPEYKKLNPQYATSTYGASRDLEPQAIAVPSNVADISAFISNLYNAPVLASGKRKAVAVRSGGHQYSGASSTDGSNFLLNLANTFQHEAPQLTIEGDKAYIKCSVSHSLVELFDFMKSKGVFCPTGQCINVHIGGHCQTGGYGMFTRSLGLLGDYMKEFDMVDTTGKVVTVSQKSNPDLWFGLLGGSPGNLGVITHAKWEVQQDKKFPGCKALWGVVKFSEAEYKRCLDIIVKKSEDPNFQRGFDFTVNIYSQDLDLNQLWPGTSDELKDACPSDFFKEDPNESKGISTNLRIPVIVLYAQWVNFGTDTYDPSFFKEIRNSKSILKLFSESNGEKPMSELASWWLFQKKREYPLPYVKRTCFTNQTNLSKNGWTDWFAKRMASIVSILDNGLWVSSQLQVSGGKFSQFRNNAGNGTAYSWRDSTFGGTWDIFYEPEKQKLAEKWQAETDAGNFGPQGKFCPDERRVIWGSYGDWDLSKAWPRYYDQETYEKIRVIRKKYDPRGIFTPNPFSVPAAI